jgi:hypothetical protein
VGRDKATSLLAPIGIRLRPGFLEDFEWGVVISRYFSFPLVLQEHFTPPYRGGTPVFLKVWNRGSFLFVTLFSFPRVLQYLPPRNLQVFRAGRFSSFPFVLPRYRPIGGRFLSFPRALGDRFLPRKILEGKCRNNKLAGGRFPRSGPGPRPVCRNNLEFALEIWKSTLQ